jgi:SOS response regulatory protein OraA/RecX
LTTAELRTRLQKKAARHPPHPEARAWIAALLLRLSESLLLDDARVAQGRIASARARGWSRRRIEQKLRGVDDDVKDQAFAAVDEPLPAGGEALASTSSPSTAELAAALIYARKRGLARKDPRKALAALARQGFSFSTAHASLHLVGQRGSPLDDAESGWLADPKKSAEVIVLR